MSGKQLSLDSRMDLVQRLVTDKSQGDQIDENSEQVINAPYDDEDATEGILTILFISLQKYFKGLLKKYYFIQIVEEKPMGAVVLSQWMEQQCYQGVVLAQVEAV